MEPSQRLLNAVEEDAAIRTTLNLQPAGGQGTKVFPPTYSGSDSQAVYATEERKLPDGSVAKCVLLDSVQSQANRMENALLDAARAGEITIPLIQTDFSSEFPDIGKITTLDAPHRIADAIFRDSNLDGTPFRKTEQGKAFENSSMDDASHLYRLCPTALLFGVWDSTGERGAQLGTKFPRALTSEIVGIDIEEGIDPSGRLSPIDIVGDESRVYKTPAGQITHKEEEAATDSEKMRPSEVNLGNVTPSYHRNAGGPEDTEPGGITMDHAELTAVLSLSGLRRLSFPRDGEQDEDRTQAGRASLASLGLVAIALQFKHGYSLRSRCNLVPEEPLEFEIVQKDGTTEVFDIPIENTLELYQNLHETAADRGLDRAFDTLDLEPTDGLVEEVRRSRSQLESEEQ